MDAAGDWGVGFGFVELQLSYVAFSRARLQESSSEALQGQCKPLNPKP